MTRRLSDNLPPPLSSEFRPEGHSHDGSRRIIPLSAVHQYKRLKPNASCSAARQCKNKREKMQKPLHTPVFFAILIYYTAETAGVCGKTENGRQNPMGG